MHSNEGITEDWLTGQYVGNCEWEEIVRTLSSFLLSTSSSPFPSFLPCLPSYNIPAVASPTSLSPPPPPFSFLHCTSSSPFASSACPETIGCPNQNVSAPKLQVQWLYLSTSVALRDRSQLPHGLRRGSTAACLLGLRVRNPPEDGCFSRECCVLIGEGLITRPEKPYRVWSRNPIVEA